MIAGLFAAFAKQSAIGRLAGSVAMPAAVVAATRRMRGRRFQGPAKDYLYIDVRCCEGVCMHSGLCQPERIRMKTAVLNILFSNSGL